MKTQIMNFSLGSNLSRFSLASLICLCMLTVGVGNAWADATFTSADEDATSAKNGISLSVSSGSLVKGEYYRINKGATLTITSSSGNITSIVFTCTTSNYAKTNSHSPEGDPYTEDGATVTWTGSATIVTFTAKSGDSNKNFRFTEVVITTSGGGSTSSVTPTPTSLDWGTVLQGSSQSTKTISITGANLTAGTLTISATGGYSVTPTSKSVSGTLAATTLTVTPPSTATTGAKNGKVTISGGGLASNVEVDLSMTVNAASTVTWMNNGSEYTTTLVANGSKPEFPSNPSSCDGTSTTFYGWSTSEWSGKIDDISAKTIYTSAASMPTVSGAITYYAVFATKGAGGGVAFDGTSGGNFKIYAIVEGTKYYASGTGSKISSTTEESNATEYTFTKISDGVFSIKTGTTYLTYVSSTNLGTRNSSYSWNISEGTKGSWRIASAANSGRGIVFRASTYNQFGGYSTGNINSRRNRIL